MKTLYYYIIAFCIAIVFFHSCKEPEIDLKNAKAPEIEFILDSLVVDLNKADNLPVLAVVYADAGLTSVEMYVVTVDDERHHKTTKTFFDKNKYSIKEHLPYSEDIVAFKIIATDKAGKITTKTLDISSIPYQMPPTITFNLEEVNVDETKNDTIPLTKVEVNSASSTFLKQVTISLYSTSGSMLLLNETFDGIDETTFSYSSLIPYQAGNRSLQVVAIDRYNKKTIASLPINYIAVPPPAIKNISHETIIADVGETQAISFDVTSEVGVNEIIVFKVNSKSETLLEKFNYNSLNTLTFSSPVTFDDNTSSIKYKITDSKGRISEFSIKTIIGFNFIENFTIGGQYYIRGFEEEPETKNIFSLRRMTTMTLGEAYNNVEDADFHIYMYYGAAGADNGIRLNAWGQTSSPTQLGEVEFADLLNGIPLVNTWPNRNRTLFLELVPSTHGFNFENVTLNDLNNFVPAVNKDRLTKVPLGEAYLVKSAPNSSVGEKLGVIKFEAMDVPTEVPYPHSFGANYSLKKCARIYISIKFPK